MKNSIIIASLVATLGITATVGIAQAKERSGPRFDFSQFDTDGDQQVTKAEIIAFQTQKFTEADADGDGNLTATEAATLFKARSERADNERSERRMERMFSRMDANEDDVLSLTELVKEERIDQMFERLDSDENGMISEGEAEKMRAHRGKRHGGGDKNPRS